MADIKKSILMQNVIQTLINISSRKTNQNNAINKMTNEISKLRNKYDFLRHVEIKDTRFIELDEPVSVMSDLDNVRTDDVGNALYDIIKNMNNALGKDAGHFFVKEFRNIIGEEYSSEIENLGVDLGLIQLEIEVNEMSRKL